MRRIASSDVDVLHRIWTDPDVRRFLWDDVVIDRETARAVVDASVRDWEEHGYGLWILEDDAGNAIGFAGFRSSEERPEPELLFGLLPSAWHRGIVTAAARAALQYLAENTSIQRVWAATDVPNTASVRVLERLGMTFDRRETIDGRDTLFYVRSLRGLE
ncbi:MAG TPA: GNAT family N-acetyltransferase [Thermoanaerobaculia bacterium]|nr:GNAT family N-acetyltransferase [Thermoanaerobaculia bacterium]